MTSPTGQCNRVVEPYSPLYSRSSPNESSGYDPIRKTYLTLNHTEFQNVITALTDADLNEDGLVNINNSPSSRNSEYDTALTNLYVQGYSRFQSEWLLDELDSLDSAQNPDEELFTLNIDASLNLKGLAIFVKGHEGNTTSIALANSLALALFNNAGVVLVDQHLGLYDATEKTNLDCKKATTYKQNMSDLLDLRERLTNEVHEENEPVYLTQK